MFKSLPQPKIFLPVFLSLLVLLMGGSVYSQEPISLQISPALNELNLDPGQVAVLDKYEIFNPGNITEEVRLETRDVQVADETGRLTLIEDSHDRYSLTKWISVEPSSLTLGPREHQPLQVLIGVPEDAEPGGHYGAVFSFTAGTKDIKAGEVGLGVTVGVASPILLTVNGPVSTTGEIVEFRQVPFLNLGPVDFLIRFKNTGTVHYQPHGFIEIFDFFGNKAATVSVDEQRVFPETIRQLKARWNRLLLFGRYRAVATIFYGLEDERKDTAQVEFWAFPYKAIFGLLGILVFLVMVSRIRHWWQERNFHL